MRASSLQVVCISINCKLRVESLLILAILESLKMVKTSLISFQSPLTPLRPPLVHEASPVAKTAGKVDSFWNQFQEWLGRFIRDAFFMIIPAHPSSEVKKLLQKEEDFAADFWNPLKPLDPNYLYQEKIRNEFHVYDQPIQMKTADGKSLEFICRIIESKSRAASQETFYNLVHVLGNLATHSNTISPTYPYLAAYLDAREKEPALPPARFILISQYAMKVEGDPFRPRSFDEAGLILKNVMETLSEKMGAIDQAVAMSLGSMIFASSLKHFEADSKATPHSIQLDRAPSSILAVSKNYYLGSFLYFVAYISGWSLDIGDELGRFYQKHPTVPCIVSGVKNEFYFPGPASLHEDEKIKKLPQVKRLVFDPPLQLFHTRAHHGLRADFLNGNYLVETTDRKFLQPEDNLANASMRYSFQVLSAKRQTAE